LAEPDPTRPRPRPPPLTVVAVGQDGDLGAGEGGAHLAPHGHAEGDVEALLVLVQRVVDHDDAAELLALVLVEAQQAGVVLGPRDVVRVGQHRAGDGARGRGWRRAGGEANRGGEYR